MIAPPKNYFFEKVTGCMFESMDEAIDQAISSAVDGLFQSFTKYENGRTCVVSTDLLLESKNEILTNIAVFRTALMSPVQLIVEYKISK